MQHLKTSVCGANQTEPQTTLPRTQTIH